jgi:hypothetical protein
LLGQNVKDAIRFFCRIEVEHHGEAFWFAIALGEHIRPLQYVFAESECGMDDLLTPLWWRLSGQRRIPLCHHQDDLAAQALLVELEGRFALAVEHQIGIQTHHALR